MSDDLWRTMADLYMRRDAIGWHELRSHNEGLIRRLAPELPPSSWPSDMPVLFFGFPVVFDQSMPKDEVILIDDRGNVVRRWSDTSETNNKGAAK